MAVQDQSARIVGESGLASQLVPDGLSLALIGNASGQTFGAEGISIRGVFDKETRRKPLGFAADAWSYGV
jgi:hypothetical protein